ncbi:EpsG family protein [Pseudomonas sp. TAE6080]|uniref:EpsG family protein n=1 Tax=Pseudomonas sp. TAE6080 TaxID=2840374 RepID=UPI001C0007C1|nr:EpsG family protein [Pseudomonas sp. TAE6080]MBT9300646.1 EpsG family protein [Pseudomonas sp. TAE6080]
MNPSNNEQGHRVYFGGRWRVTTPGAIVAFFFVAVASLLIALRPIGFDNDYQTCLEYYDNILAGDPPGVEVGYQLISLVFDYLGIGFVGVLYTYAFIALYTKFKFFQRLDSYRGMSEGLFFFIVYFLVFFPVWELTQIRNAAAVAVAALAILEKRKASSGVYFLFAVLLHNVSFLIIALWLAQRFFSSIKYPIVLGVALVVFLGLEYAPYYQLYAADIYKEDFNPLSLKNLFIVLTFVYIQFCKQPLAKSYAYYSLSLLLFYLAMGKMPAAAIRVADISLFFALLALSLAHLRFSWLYKLLTIFALGYVFTNISYLGESPLINLGAISWAG